MEGGSATITMQTRHSTDCTPDDLSSGPEINLPLSAYQQSSLLQWVMTDVETHTGQYADKRLQIAQPYVGHLYHYFNFGPLLISR